MPEPTLHEVHSALAELRTTVESKNYSHLDALDKTKVDSINEFLDSQETKNADITAKLGLERKANEDMQDRLDGLEKIVAHSSTTDKKNYKEGGEYKALESFMKFGDRMDHEQKALLRTDIDGDGGYRTGTEQDPEMIKNISEISPIRNFARVRSVSEKQFRMVRRNSLLTATWEGEAQTGSDSASAYGLDIMNTWRQTVTVPVTLDQLMNDQFEMESDIFSDASEAFGVAEGTAFVLNAAAKGPKGFLVDAAVTGLTSTTSGTIDADDFILIQGELKGPYNGMYALNRRTLAVLRTKKSTDGNFLFAPGLNGAAANTIAGANYMIAQDMPDIAVGNKAVAYGDFLRGYTIIDRTGVSIIRDDFTRKRDAVVEFTIHRWLNGQVRIAEALKTITVKA
ncbi:MAG: phage major capsid protein [Gammaproteobacteria bacterium]|nr:phage major capsid protein [Gammaproteobacteria bacterium]